MKYISIGVLILCISSALAFNLTDITSLFNNNKNKSGLCGIRLLSYANCITSLTKATEGKDVSELESGDICPVYETTKCSEFVKDMYDGIDCDTSLGELTKYTLTLFRLYYLSFCTKTTDGKSCPVTNLIKETTPTIETINKNLQDSCEDKNCNKAFVAMTNIMDKNINNKYLYEYLIGFTMNISYKALGRSFSENQCSSIEFITSNRDLFYGVEDLYNDFINIIYQLSFGNVPNYSGILSIISKIQNTIDKEKQASEQCFNQFNNYSECFKQFEDYEKTSVSSSSDVTNMCKKFDDDSCSSLLSDLKSNNVNCSDSYVGDTIYRAVFIALRFTYISACSKTKDNTDYCPIAKYLQTSHKIGDITKDFLQSVTDTCNDSYCNDEFYKITDLITQSNIYNSIISSDFDYESFFNKFKKHSCNAFKIGLGIFEIIDDIFSLINQIVVSVIDLGIDIIDGIVPNYENIKDNIEKLDKNTNIFGINKECLAQVWRYSSCVKLFISSDSYNDVKNITTTDICNIFEDKNCEAFVSDLLSEESKCINSNSNHEQIYKKIHSTLKLTYLSTCSKKTDEDEYCPIVDFMKTGTNITEAGTEKYVEALKSTCEDTSCNKSYSEVYKIIYDSTKEAVEEGVSKRDGSVISADVEINANIDIDLSKAVDLLENNKCVSFAKVMIGDNSSSGGELKSKINMLSILIISVLSIFLLV